MATGTKIYFSHSFHDVDKPVVGAVRDVFDEIRNRYNLQDVGTARATSEQLFSRLVRPMRDVDIVVCIFTKRHEVAGPNGPTYTAPPYVVAEAAAAYVQQKRVLVFVEKGLPREELGFIDAYNPQWKEIDRDRCGHTDYHRELRQSVEESLQWLLKDRPPTFTFEMYDAQIALYPNGYILTNNRLDVRVLKDEAIKHSFQLYPEGDGSVELPTASRLYATGKENPSPFPTEPFTAFASSTPAAKLVAVDRPASFGPVRDYRIELGSVGTHHYEWMWGTPSGFQPARARDWYLMAISQRAIERVRIVFRIHRQLKREREPRWAQITSGRLDDGDPDDTQITMIESEAEPLDVVRDNPLFRCYELSFNEIRRGYDLLLLY